MTLKVSASESPVSDSSGIADPSPIEDVTGLLDEWSGGDPQALDRLMVLLAHELHQRARGFLQKESSSHTLQPTALVHEVYLRLVGRRRVDWRNRAQFLGFASQVMRRILVDHARRRQASKRGGLQTRVELGEELAAIGPWDVDVLDLDKALNRLAALDPRQARLVELRFFAGLTVRETAEVLGVSVPTVERHWTAVKAWLHLQLMGEAAPGCRAGGCAAKPSR